MPGITNPAEAFFKDGIWGWAATVWEKLVSSGGRLFTALHGWDGDSWQKLPMLWGYSEHYATATDQPASGTGDAVVSSVAVVAGYVHVVQSISIMHNAGANKRASVFLWDGAVATYLLDIAAQTTDIWAVWQGQVVLHDGDQLTATAFAPGNGKYIWLRAWGYKMKIAE